MNKLSDLQDVKLLCVNTSNNVPRPGSSNGTCIHATKLVEGAIYIGKIKSYDFPSTTRAVLTGVIDGDIIHPIKDGNNYFIERFRVLPIISKMTEGVKII